MFKDKKLLSLYLFYTTYFLAIGLTTYSGKFYGEIGLNDSQIGMISAVPSFIALFAQPIWGSISDRVKYKRNVVAVALVIGAGFALLVQPASDLFLPLLAVLTLMNTFTLPVLPVGNAIAIEYTRDTGHAFGPVRMMGTVGYQVIILVAGFFFVSSLRGLYNVYAGFLLLTAVTALLLPSVQGHQHGKEKVSFTVFFKDNAMLMMFLLIFLAQMCSRFYLAFFSKHLGDLGISNSATGIITMLTVALEVPFLIVGDRLMKKLSIWRWMWIGLILTGLRFFALSAAKTPLLIVISAIPTVALTACFEFFPAIHVNNTVMKELRGAAQNAIGLIGGAAGIAGTLVGGFIANATSIPTMFAINGTILCVAAIVLFVPLNRRAKADTARG